MKMLKMIKEVVIMLECSKLSTPVINKLKDYLGISDSNDSEFKIEFKNAEIYIDDNLLVCRNVSSHIREIFISRIDEVKRVLGTISEDRLDIVDIEFTGDNKLSLSYKNKPSIVDDITSKIDVLKDIVPEYIDISTLYKYCDITDITNTIDTENKHTIINKILDVATESIINFNNAVAKELRDFGHLPSREINITATDISLTIYSNEGNVYIYEFPLVNFNGNTKRKFSVLHAPIDMQPIPLKGGWNW